jgi:LmbE family N-acetylglucosaminyl deacetylase
MNKKILVVAPHPDDETLGIGGTLLKHQENGDFLYWLLMTTVNAHPKYSNDYKKQRVQQIETVASLYKMKQVIQLPFLCAGLDRHPLGDIIEAIGDVIADVKPNIIYIPFAYDVHSDHRITFDAVSACSKTFRHNNIEEVLMYETPSETDFTPVSYPAFNPTVFVNVTNTFDKKLSILKHYESELGEHPFPRSVETIHALAKLRGAQSNFNFAEAFVLLKQRRY